jgi:hypothetical protein
MRLKLGFGKIARDIADGLLVFGKIEINWVENWICDHRGIVMFFQVAGEQLRSVEGSNHVMLI